MQTMHTSPDGLLKFVVVRDDTNDVTLGFEGYEWHTHGDVLAGYYGVSQEIAVRRFVDGLLNNRSIVAISSRDGQVLDVWITDDPQADLRHKPEDETIEFRFWDGSIFRM